MSYRTAVNIFFFINGFIFASWASRLPGLQEAFGMDNQNLGFVLLAHSTGAFIAMPVTGWLINIKGSRFTTTVSALLFPLFFAIIPFMPSQLAVFVPFFLMGAATGVMDVAMNAQAVEVERLWAKPIMTMFHALFSIGMMIGALVGSWFTAATTPLSMHFLSVAILSFLILSGTSYFLCPDEASISSDDEDDVLFAWPKGPIVGLGVIAFCGMMGEGAMSDWSTNYMKNIVSIPIHQQAFGLIGFAAMMTVGRLFGDKGRARFGDRKMMLSGACLSLLGIGLVLSLLHPYIVILGFGLIGLGLSNIAPIVYSLAGSFPDIKPGVGIAMSTTIGYTGFMLGPPVIGFIADASDLRIALGFIALLFVIMTMIVLRFKST